MAIPSEPTLQLMIHPAATAPRTACYCQLSIGVVIAYINPTVFYQNVKAHIMACPDCVYGRPHSKRILSQLAFGPRSTGGEQCGCRKEETMKFHGYSAPFPKIALRSRHTNF